MNQQYKVEPGDTLTKIATRFGVDRSALAKLNNIDNINLIRIGQVLNIPQNPPLENGAPTIGGDGDALLSFEFLDAAGMPIGGLETNVMIAMSTVQNITDSSGSIPFCRLQKKERLHTSKYKFSIWLMEVLFSRALATR